MSAAFQDALVNRLSDACVVRDEKVFDEPENYTALKGSMIFYIRASPSSQDPKVAAITVDMFSPQGPYIGQRVSLGFLPILIESDADFRAGAQAVMDHWTQVGKALDKLNHEKNLE